MVKNRLKEIMAKKNVKQVDLVTVTGVTKATISNIVNNRFEPSIGIAFKISEFLNTPVDEIFYEEDSFLKIIDADCMEKKLYRVDGILQAHESFTEEHIIKKLRNNNLINFIKVKLEPFE